MARIRGNEFVALMPGGDKRAAQGLFDAKTRYYEEAQLERRRT